MTNVINLAIAKQNLAASGSVFPQDAYDSMMAGFSEIMQAHEETVERAINWREWEYVA